MMRHNWILAGIGAVVGLVLGVVFSTTIPRTGDEGLAPVSAAVPPSEYVDLTDRALIEKLLPREPVVFYQFLGEDGQARFVQTLTEVPPEWRERVGFVEMAAVPQRTPAGARMIRKLDGNRDRSEIETN